MDIGAIFDWDGIVIDSSKAHEESWELLAAEENLPLFPGHFKLGFGRKNQWIIPNLLKWSQDPAQIERLADRKEALYRAIIAERGIEALPGARELLKFFKEKGIPCVVGSSTPRLNVETIMDVLGVREYFAGICAAEDVTRGKPDPEVFLKAAAKINRRPERCVVFEDAHYGIDAALAGGMKAVAVGTTHPLDSFEKADIKVRWLSDLDTTQLLALF